MPINCRFSWSSSRFRRPRAGFCSCSSSVGSARSSHWRRQLSSCFSAPRRRSSTGGRPCGFRRPRPGSARWSRSTTTAGEEDIVAAILLVVAILSLLIGVAFTGCAAALVISRRERRRLWVAIVPLALFAIWWVWAQKYGGRGQSAVNVLLAPSWAADSFAAACAALSGLGVRPNGCAQSLDHRSRVGTDRRRRCVDPRRPRSEATWLDTASMGSDHIRPDPLAQPGPPVQPRTAVGANP